MRYLSPTGFIAMAWFGIAVFLSIETLEFPPSLSHITPSSAIYPRLLLLMLAILSLLVLIEIPTKMEEESFTSVNLKQFISRNSTVLKYCTLLVFYPYLVVWLGYFVTTPLIIVLMSWSFGLRNKVMIAVLTLSITLFIYFIFCKILLVPLPSGLLL
jgi:hypothetical protein